MFDFVPLDVSVLMGASGVFDMGSCSLVAHSVGAHPVDVEQACH